MPMTKRQLRERAAIDAKRFQSHEQKVTRGLDLALLALVLIELGVVIAWRINGGAL